MTQVLEQPPEIEDTSEPMGRILQLDARQPGAAAPSRGLPAGLAPPGWYPDRVRYWSGTEWTDEVRPMDSLSHARVRGPTTRTPRTARRHTQRVIHDAAVPVVSMRTTNRTGAEIPKAINTGPLGFPPPQFDPASRMGAPGAELGLLHEVKILLLVLAVAMIAGALVTTMGIMLTV